VGYAVLPDGFVWDSMAIIRWRAVGSAQTTGKMRYRGFIFMIFLLNENNTIYESRRKKNRDQTITGRFLCTHSQYNIIHIMQISTYETIDGCWPRWRNEKNYFTLWLFFTCNLWRRDIKLSSSLVKYQQITPSSLSIWYYIIPGSIL